jgi:two-component system response regulator AtoC
MPHNADANGGVRRGELMATILLADDEAGIRRLLGAVLEADGHVVVTAESGAVALHELQQRTYELILLDLRMPGLTGMDLLRAVRARQSALACVVMTALGSVRTAVDAMQAGACDFIQKPCDNDELRLVVRRALSRRQRSVQQPSDQVATDGRDPLSHLVGASPVMQEVSRLITRAATSDDTVLIVGESGTGKELVARAIHGLSRRADGPFVAVDCGALPPSLIEAELFGAERGAFTGADRTRKGLFEQAKGGVLFLDEIGNLPKPCQATLLRVLQERVVRRVGGASEINIDVRLIAATNEDLGTDEEGTALRRDLFFRLNVLSVVMPPLRERCQDIPALTDHFVATTCAETGRAPRTVAPETRALLSGYRWPGNIRELQNAVRRAIVNSEGDVIVPADLPPQIRPHHEMSAESSVVGSLHEEVRSMVWRFERRRLSEALAQVDGRRLEAATLLGLPERTLFRKLKQYGLSNTVIGGRPA